MHRASPSTRKTMSGSCTVRARSSLKTPGRRRPRSSCLIPPATSSRLGAGRAADMTGPSASTASISTTRALSGWGGNNCPTSGPAGPKPIARDAYFKFRPDGKFVLQIGKSNQSKGDADTINVHRAADAWVHAPTNELFVSDGYGNHRVIIFDADTGAFKRMWGAFAKPPGGEDSCAIVSPKTFPDPEGPAHFNVAHAIRVANDGMVYLADRENRRVQMFTSDGKFIKQLIRTGTPFARNLALSADSQQQFLYVGADKGITVVDRKTLDVVGAIQPAGILGPGHHIATDSKGNIYLAQTTAGMQKLVFKGMPPTQ